MSEGSAGAADAQGVRRPKPDDSRPPRLLVAMPGFWGSDTRIANQQSLDKTTATPLRGTAVLDVSRRMPARGLTRRHSAN
jgi:hypothetical protein